MIGQTMLADFRTIIRARAAAEATIIRRAFHNRDSWSSSRNDFHLGRECRRIQSTGHEHVRWYGTHDESAEKSQTARSRYDLTFGRQQAQGRRDR